MHRVFIQLLTDCTVLLYSYGLHRVVIQPPTESTVLLYSY